MKTNNTTKVSEIIAAINLMDGEELIQLNNLYCQSANYSDNEIYENDEDFFNTFFDGQSPYSVLQRAHFGDYKWHHAYVTFDGYGNLESFDHMDTDRLVDLVPTLAEYIAENESDFIDLFDFDAMAIEEN